MDKVMDADGATLLQAHGIRPSVQRIAIMGYLRGHLSHPTVEEIHAAIAPSMSSLSKTTVYNTLKLLSERGVAQTLTIDERNTHYDADTQPHGHFLCKRCGRIYDLPLPDAERVGEVEAEGHDVQEIHCYYKGICKHCREEKRLA